MSEQVGAIHYELGLDSKQFDKAVDDLNKSVGSKLTSLGESFKNVGTKWSLAITTPITGAGIASFKLAADLQDAMGAADSIFKTSSQEMQNWAKNLDTYYGIAEGEALTYANTMGSMLQNIGGLTEEQAAKQAQTLIALAGDLTAMFGGKTQDAVRALTGSLKGNNTMLDNYGMAVNDVMIKTKALELGVLKEGETMTLAAKQAATLALITEQTASVTGQASRESEGASGSMRALTTTMKNLGSDIGTILLPVATELINKIVGIVEKVQALSPEQKKWIVIIGGIVAAIGPLLLIIGTLLPAIAAIGTALGVIIPIMGAVMAGLFTFLISPIGILVVVLAGLAFAIYKNWDAIKEKTLEFVEYIKGKFDELSSKWNTFKENTSNMINGVKGYLSELIEAIKDIPGLAGQALERLSDAISKPFRDAYEKVKGIVNDIKNAMDKINPFHKESPSLVENVIKGASIIRDQFEDLTNITMPKIGDVAMTGRSGLQQTINMNIARVSGENEVRMLGREFGYRTAINPLVTNVRQSL